MVEMTSPKKDEPSNPLTMVAASPLSTGLVFGIDVGIGSCGWAVVDRDKKVIKGVGSHCFEAAEDSKTHKLKNQTRRAQRGARRITRRRKDRIYKIRALLEEFGVCENSSPERLHRVLFSDRNQPFDVWQARVSGLDERLPTEEVAAVLLHIANHRGYFSNSLSDRKDAVDEKRKILKAIEEQEKQAEEKNYRSYAEQVVKEESLQNDPLLKRRRNRQGDYKFMPTRKRLREEAQEILATQSKEGASWVTPEFTKRYSELAFEQRPLASSRKMVGDCQFEDNRKRSSRFAPTFEKFRLASHLAREMLEGEGVSRSLTDEEIEKVLALLGETKTLTYKKIRRTLKIENFLRFKEAIPSGKKGDSGKEDDPEKKDITGTKDGAGAGSYLLREALQCLGAKAWQSITEKPFCLDAIADILTFESELDTIKDKTQWWQEKFELPEGSAEAITKACEKGEFDRFKGTAHLSAKAAGKILVELRRGKVELRQGNMYHEACENAGYDHTRMRREDIAKISNAVVRRALIRARQQVAILVREYGRPEAIHVELLRDVGKSAKQRELIRHAQTKRGREREEARADFERSFGSCS